MQWNKNKTRIIFKTEPLIQFLKERASVHGASFSIRLLMRTIPVSLNQASQLSWPQGSSSSAKTALGSALSRLTDIQNLIPGQSSQKRILRQEYNRKNRNNDFIVSPDSTKTFLTDQSRLFDFILFFVDGPN